MKKNIEKTTTPYFGASEASLNKPTVGRSYSNYYPEIHTPIIEEKTNKISHPSKIVTPEVEKGDKSVKMLRFDSTTSESTDSLKCFNQSMVDKTFIFSDVEYSYIGNDLNDTVKISNNKEIKEKPENKIIPTPHIKAETPPLIEKNEKLSVTFAQSTPNQSVVMTADKKTAQLETNEWNIKIIITAPEELVTGNDLHGSVEINDLPENMNKTIIINVSQISHDEEMARNLYHNQSLIQKENFSIEFHIPKEIIFSQDNRVWTKLQCKVLCHDKKYKFITSKMHEIQIVKPHTSIIDENNIQTCNEIPIEPKEKAEE
ncbi:hypothetical protein HZS_4851 [Henneguya salminicola]|nr:hypothetical protein HZS_4851 [Henneguya salminicola]